MHKISTRHFVFNKISKRSEKDMIEEMRNKVKQDPSVQEKFEEYGVPLEKMDEVPIEFADLDVSAKTKNKKIYLNRDLLDADSAVKDSAMYISHEIVHFLQQFTGKNMDKHSETDDYLEKETEEEAFSVQEDYIERTQGEEEAEEYIDDLLDYHDYNGKKREKKKEELME